MRLSWKGVKATLFLINHVVAFHVPRAEHAQQLYGRDDSNAAGNAELDTLLVPRAGNINIWSFLDQCDCKECNGKNEIKNKDDCKKCDTCKPGQKPNRARNKCIGENEKDDQDCRKDCKPTQILDPADCTKCQDCPQGKQADPTKTKCQDPSNDDKCSKTCKDDEIHDSDCTTCKKCGPGQKSDPTKKQCIPAKEEDKDCQKTCPGDQIIESTTGIHCVKCKPCPRDTRPDPAKKTCVPAKEDKDCQKTCSGDQIIKSTTGIHCVKCEACPKGKKPDPSKKVCKNSDERKKQKKTKAETDTKNRERQKYRMTKGKKKEQRLQQKTLPMKKTKFQPTLDKRDRMSMCLFLVSLGMAGVADGGLEYANNFFDNDFLTSPELDGYWPADMPNVPPADLNSAEISTSYFEADYKDPPVVMGVNIQSVGRRSPRLRRRFLDKLFNAIKSLFTGGSNAGKAAQGAASAASAIGKHVSDKFGRLTNMGGMKVAPKGTSKAGRQAQQQAAKKVAENKNWKNCLKGQKAARN